MPKSKDLDPPGRCIYLVVEVIAGPVEQKPANAFSRRIARLRSDSRLSDKKFEGALEIVREGERRRRSIGSPPSPGPADLRSSSRRGPDGKTCGQRLLAKLPKKSFRVDELPLRRLPEGLLQGGLLLGRKLKRLVALGDQYRDRDTLFEGLAFEL